jgi:hypothetical protein
MSAATNTRRVAVALVVAAGALGAAHAEPSPLAPVPRYAPKGRPPIAGETHAPWSPGSHGANAGDLEYLYVAVSQGGTHTGGAGATIMQADPALGIGDYHSLAEIAIESADQQQIVEIGWTVDAGVNGDVQPHVFAYHWVDGQGTCYNACGWVQVSPHKRPGMRVKPGEAHRYEIQRVHDDWWLFYDGEAMGYYPQSLWSGSFQAVGLTQWFGEVSASVTAPCTQMGNGKPGAHTDATSFTELHLFDTSGTPLLAAAVTGAVTSPGLYNIGRAMPTSFAFGGPGAATGCCTPSTCVAASAECGQLTDPACSGNTLLCGSCEGDVCTADHTCPTGVGPRDDGELFEGPQAGASGGCCDAHGAANGTSSLVLAAFAFVGAIARRRRSGGSG